MPPARRPKASQGTWQATRRWGRGMARPSRKTPGRGSPAQGLHRGGEGAPFNTDAPAPGLAAWPPARPSAIPAAQRQAQGGGWGGVCSWVPSGPPPSPFLGVVGVDLSIAPLEGQRQDKEKDRPQRPRDWPRSGSSRPFFRPLHQCHLLPEALRDHPNSLQHTPAVRPACLVLFKALATTWKYLNYAFTCILSVSPPTPTWR